jgi:hypothetical protein
VRYDRAFLPHGEKPVPRDVPRSHILYSLQAAANGPAHVLADSKVHVIELQPSAFGFVPVHDPCCARSRRSSYAASALAPGLHILDLWPYGPFVSGAVADFLSSTAHTCEFVRLVCPSPDGASALPTRGWRPVQWHAAPVCVLPNTSHYLAASLDACLRHQFCFLSPRT